MTAVLTLVGKPDCHLCHDMRAALAPILAEFGLDLADADITQDAELERLYKHDIPVLLLDGVELARHHLDAAALRDRLRARGLLPRP